MFYYYYRHRVQRTKRKVQVEFVTVPGCYGYNNREREFVFLFVSPLPPQRKWNISRKIKTSAVYTADISGDSRNIIRENKQLKKWKPKKKKNRLSGLAWSSPPTSYHKYIRVSPPLRWVKKKKKTHLWTRNYHPGPSRNLH